MIIEGVDYSTARPSPVGLYAAGKRFAARYGGPPSAAKHLTASELHALRAAGLDVVAVAEGSSNGYRGFAAGQQWALSAEHDFRTLGMPADRPIYFAVDWDAQPSDWPDIDAACHGSASIIGAGRVGVYGGYNVITHCHAVGSANWFWQTFAWSGGRLHPAAHMYQWRNSVTLAGGQVDFTRALTRDYGQWGISTIGDNVSAAEARQGIADAFSDAAKSVNANPNDDILWGRQFRESVNAVIDFSNAVSPIGDRIAALEAKVDQMTNLTPELLAAAFRILFKGP